MEEYVDGMYKRIVRCVKAANAIPSEDNDFHYHMKFQSFRDSNQQLSHRLDRLLNRVVQQSHAISHVSSDQDQLTMADLPNISHLLQQWLESKNEQFYDECAYISTDVVDGLLERADFHVTSYLNPKSKATRQEETKEKATDFKPQTQFQTPVDNSIENPFSHLRLETDAPKGSLTQADEDEMVQHGHPYYPEIVSIQYTPTQLTVANEIESLKSDRLETRSCTWVDSIEKLAILRDTLEDPTCTEFAVDLEHHSIRSYLGFTCLMQISTRSEDFLVDTIALRSEIPEYLHAVFVDPTTCKVFHGANMDIKWLQCDFKMYVVNMFDTGQAARVLSYPGFSLAYLLQLHCQLSVDKQYQLADWRTRPLTPEMRAYARQDTVDLLYIYDQMRRELLRASEKQPKCLLQTVYERSSELCLQLYQKPRPPTREDTRRLCLRLCGRTYDKYAGQRHLSDAQVNVLHGLNVWRDRIGRELDESLPYVLPNKVLIAFARKLPTVASQLVKLCGNASVPVLDRYKKELIELIQTKASEETPPMPDPRLKSSKPASHKRFFYPSLDHTKVVEHVAMTEFSPWNVSSRTVQVVQASKGLLSSTSCKRVYEELNPPIEWKVRSTKTLEDMTEIAPIISVLKETEEKTAPLPKSIAETYSMPVAKKPRKQLSETSSTVSSFKPFEYKSSTTEGETTTTVGFNPFVATTTAAASKPKNKKKARHGHQPKSNTYK